MQAKKLEPREVASCLSKVSELLIGCSVAQSRQPLSRTSSTVFSWVVLVSICLLTSRNGMWKDRSYELLSANVSFRWFYRC